MEPVTSLCVTANGWLISKGLGLVLFMLLNTSNYHADKGKHGLII